MINHSTLMYHIGMACVVLLFTLLINGCTSQSTKESPLLSRNIQNKSLQHMPSSPKRLGIPLIFKDNDWPMFGKNMGRTSETTLSFKDSTFKQMWEFKPSEHTFIYREGTNIWSESAVAVSLNNSIKISIGSYNHKLYTLNGLTGKILYSFNTGDEITSTPIECKDSTICISSDRTIYSISSSGSKTWASLLQQWTDTAQPMVASSPVAFSLDRKLYFSGGYYLNDSAFFRRRQEGYAYTIEAKTGRPLWVQHLRQSTIYGPAAASIAQRNVLFYTTGDGLVCALAADNGELIWKFTADQQIRSTPAVASCNGKHYLLVSTRWGIIWALDCHNGKPLWSYRTGHMCDSSPAVATITKDNKIVIVGSYDRCVHGIDLRSGKGLWKFQTGGAVLSSPSIGLIQRKPAVFFTSMDNTIYAIDALFGSKIWSFKTGPLPWPYFKRGDAVFSSPLICGSEETPILVVPCHDGIVRAFSSNN